MFSRSMKLGSLLITLFMLQSCWKSGSCYIDGATLGEQYQFEAKTNRKARKDCQKFKEENKLTEECICGI